MKRFELSLSILLMLLGCGQIRAAESGGYQLRQVQVNLPTAAPVLSRRAGDELCRYIYLLAGQWPLVVSNTTGTGRIIIRTGADARVPSDGPDPAQNFALYVEHGNQVVHGASPVATLWAAYELIESWGVGFYLGGDHLPKADADLRVAFVERVRRPALAIRGNVPWCNFANSPTSWNPQDYRTFFEQMAKQKANFIGFHAYDHEPFAAYFPTQNGVQAGGRLMTSKDPWGRCWSPPTWGAWDGLFGTDQFFDRDNWASEIAATETNMAAAVKAQQQAMIDALGYARTQLGIKTCMGFEVSGDSADPKASDAFVARLTHLLDAFPLDYIWVWQGEAGSVNRKERRPESELSEDVRRNFDYLDREFHDLHEAQRILGWMRLAHKTIKEKKPEVQMIVSGWGGEQYLKFSDYYPGLDKLLPGDVIFSALDHIDPLHLEKQPGIENKKPVSKSTTYPARPGNYISGSYGQLAPTRQRWPILWFESDGYRNSDQTGPQPNVQAFEDAMKDTLAKGCQGVLGIHWRTRNVQDVAGYLYRFGWQPGLSAQEYFKNYARDMYGSELADAMATVHLKLDQFGSQYVGASGAWECASKFAWFTGSGKPDAGRLAELRKLRDDLLAKSAAALRGNRPSAATELRDLANTIDWLVIRAETGMQIWQAEGSKDMAPLLKRLIDAEELAAKGEVEKGKQEALVIAAEVEKLNFKEALPALAATCRTRGEQGMLLTANQRYGRYYSEFTDRLRKLVGHEVLPYKTVWTGGEVHNSFPVPNQIEKGQTVNFDVVLLPTALPRKCVVELMPQESIGAEKVVLPMKLIGGSIYRAAFTSPRVGAFAWQIKPEDGVRRDELSWPSGVLIVR
jgi:hypothetical protein